MTRERVRGLGGAERAAAFLARRPWLVYLGLVPFAHPILEILLFGERALQTAHDVFDDDVPRLFSIPADWRAFGPSLWDAHLTGGNAVLAQFALPPLAPDVLLSFLVPPYVAYALNAALMVFVAGVAMHVFLRDSLRLPAAACFAGGVLALFGFWHYILGYAALAAPIALLWSERAASSGSARDTVRLAVLVACIAFSSQVQVVAILGVASLAWVLALAAGPRDAIGRAVRLLRGWLAGAGLAAPLLLTLFVAVGESQRTLWVVEASADPVGQWLSDIASVAFGVPVLGLDRVSPLYGTFFSGLVGVALLAVSLAIPRPDRRSRAALALLLGALVADLVAIVVTPLQANDPLLRSFQFVRVLHLVPVAVAMNVALAVGWLVRDPQERQTGRVRKVAVVAAVVAAAAAIAVQVPVALGRLLDGADATIDRTSVEPATAGWLLAVAGDAVGIVVLAIIAIAMFRRARGSRARGLWPVRLSPITSAILVAGLAIGQAMFVRGSVFTRSGLGAWADWVPATAAQRYVAAQPGDGRTLSILEHANRSLSAGLVDAGGYETVYPVRYHALFGLLLRPQTQASPGLAAYFEGWGNRAYAFNAAIAEPIADLLGIRWVLVRETAIDPDLAKRAGAQVEVPAWLTARTAVDGVTVYENGGAFPRAFLANRTVVLPDQTAVASALSAATSEELRTTAFLVAAEAPADLPPDATVATDSMVQITRETADRLDVDVRASRDTILVVRDTYTPGWAATIDGHASAVFPVDIGLRAVVIPAGEHVVILSYRPTETYAGIGIAGLTLLALLGWLVRPRLRRRRAPATPGAALNP